MAPKAGLLVSHLDWPSVALYAQRANLRHFFNISKRVFMLRVFHLSSTYLTFFIAKLTAEWSRVRAPRTRHKRYDSCFGYRRSRVRSPVRPRFFVSCGRGFPNPPT